MPLQTLTLSLQFARFDGAAEHRAALPRHKVARWIRHALALDAEITVRIVDMEEGRQLNRDYRQKDYATNVLTFDYTQEPVVTADLVLCAPVVAREAAVQSGRSLVPEVSDCLSFSDLNEALKAHEQVLIPWEAGGLPLRAAYQGAKDIALVIGPEGGMTEGEVEALGGQAITLGPRILRADTAAISALTLWQAAVGDWDR